MNNTINATNTTKGKSTARRALAVLLTLLMVFGNIGLLSGVFKDELSANAASSTYTWRIYIKTTNSADCNDHGDCHIVRVYGMANNGTGTQSNIWDDTSVPSSLFQKKGNTYDKSGTSTSFPMGWYVATYLDGGAGWVGGRKWEGDIKLYVNGTEVYSGNHYNAGNDEWDSVSSTIDASHYPYASTNLAVSGDSPVTCCNGAVSKTYTASAVDQWNVT